MIKIEFYKDEEGNSQVISLLDKLSTQSSGDPITAKFYFLIINGLDVIRRHGIPVINSLVELQHEDGSPYTIRLIKDLVHHKDLYEFRVNWRDYGSGAFRAIFFNFEFQDENILFITKAILKDQTYSLEFENSIEESKVIKNSVLNDPKEYFKNTGDDIDE